MFGLSKLQIFHCFSTLSFQNFRLHMGGTRSFVRMFWIACSLQQKRTAKLLKDLDKQYFQYKVLIWNNVLNQ
jgi:hypothetical protein